jgi:hypothetical protein
MSTKKLSVSQIAFSEGFNPKEVLELKSAQKGMVWKKKGTNNDIICRSPLLEVVYPPTPAPGRSNEFSMALRVHFGKNPSVAEKHQEMFKQLSEVAQDNAINFMMKEKNGKRYAKKTFENQGEFKVTRFWYNDENFYMRFRPSVAAHLFDSIETKKTGKKVYNLIKDDVRLYLGEKSLISVDFIPTAFFYQKKETLYPFSLNIEKIVIWDPRENNPDTPIQRSGKNHSFLEGFSLDIPLGYKLPEEIEHQADVPVTHVNTFNNANYSLSDLKDGSRGPIIYARYGDSYGPTYFKATNVVIKYGIQADPEYNTRSIVLEDCKENASVIKMIREQHSKLVDTVTKFSENILGSKCDRDTVEESISNPLYSQKDSEKENPRISIKLPREEKSDKPLFDLYLLPEDEEKSIVSVDMGDTCDEAEKYIDAGTVCRSIVFMTRPVIVGSQVYLSARVEQILVDPNQNKIFTPPLNGFAFPGYDNVNIESRSNKTVIPFTGENIKFTNYDEKKKSFSVLFEDEDGKTSEYGIPPYPITVAYDIGLVNDPDNNQYAYRIRYNLTDEKQLLYTRNIDNKTVNYCVDNSKNIFGSKKTNKVVDIALGKGKLEKYSKKDTEKTEPYSTMKAPVYEKNDGYNIAFEAYRLINPVDSDGVPDIQKVPINQPEDLIEVFHADSTILPIYRIRGTFVDQRIILSKTVAQVLILPHNTDGDIPFDDTIGDDIISLSSTIQKEFNNSIVKSPVNETKNSQEEILETETNGEIKETVEKFPSKNITSKNITSDNDESDDESEEEEESEED